MINVQTDLKELTPAVFDKAPWQFLKRIAREGSAAQVDCLLDWSYSGCSAAMAECLYEIAGRKYPFAD